MIKKIGILGCSAIAEKALIPAINANKNFQLAGVASRSAAKRKSWSSKWGVPAYTYQGLLESDVDAVYISLPVGLHYHWGLKTLRARKHLLMEKTFTCTHAEGKKLFDMASRKGLGCMEALMYEFHPLHNQIDDLLSNLGELRHITATFGFPHFSDTNNIRYSPELGGGAILDCLIYPLSFIFRLLGENYTNRAATIHYDEKYNIDDRGYIQLEYPKTTANIAYGFGHAYRNEVAIWGSKGILKAKRVFSRPKECDEGIFLQLDREAYTYTVHPANHFVKMLDAFASCIDGGANKSQATLSRLDFMDNLRN